MKLKSLASKPTLIKIIIDDEKIVESYGEPVEFCIYDRQPLDVFMKLATIEDDAGIGELSLLVRELIMDEDGKQVLANGEELPVDIMIKVVNEIVGRLGNSLTQTLGKSAQS